MQREEIEITILPDGRVEYLIRGVKGPHCEEISALLERLGQIESSERTEDYYDTEPEVHLNVGEP